MTTPLADFVRFPGRRWAHAITAQMTPAGGAPVRLEMAVRVRWSHHIRVMPDAIMLFATAEEAARAAVQALLVPSDVALVAQPLPHHWVGAVLHAGARYVDVGRRFDGPLPTGAWHRQAAERAVQAHPEAVAIVEAPAWSGADDTQLALDLPVRATIVDATRSANCLGPALTAGRGTFTLVALRDPDNPVAPVLYGLVGAADAELEARIAIGPTAVPEPLAERAFAVLDGLARHPEWPAASAARLAVRYAEWTSALAGRPGVVPLGQAGLEAAALCLGDDSAVIARDLTLAFPGVQAWNMAPMRGLLTVHLLA
jgi:hypothetical protein